MKNLKQLLFIIWMLGAPLISSLPRYLYNLASPDSLASEVVLAEVIFEIIIYCSVGYLLHKMKNPSPGKLNTGH